MVRMIGIGLGVFWMLSCGCAADVGLEGPLDPCNPDGLTCVWEDSGRCCIVFGSTVGSNCDLWVEAEELSCSPYVAGRVYELSTGAAVTCRPNGAECENPL